MRVLSLSTLHDFFNQPAYADAKGPLLYWYRLVLKAAWKMPADVKADFRTASILKEGRVVFNIHGNKYRIVASINYDFGVMFVKFVGTHGQYDAIDAQTV